MKTFIVTSPKECREVGEKEKPDGSNHNNNGFAIAMWALADAEYQNYIKSLPTYPILSSNSYEVGETFDGEIEYQDCVRTPWERCTKDAYDKLTDNVRRIVIIPVQQEKEEKPDESSFDGRQWKYDYDLLQDLTYRVNQREHGYGLSMEEVEDVLLEINYQPSHPLTEHSTDEDFKKSIEGDYVFDRNKWKCDYAGDIILISKRQTPDNEK